VSSTSATETSRLPLPVTAKAVRLVRVLVPVTAKAATKFPVLKFPKPTNPFPSACRPRAARLGTIWGRTTGRVHAGPRTSREEVLVSNAARRDPEEPEQAEDPEELRLHLQFLRDTHNSQLNHSSSQLKRSSSQLKRSSSQLKRSNQVVL
jgi:hypothetical protein